LREFVNENKNYHFLVQTPDCTNLSL
jgi:hypothetical protein